MIPSASPLALIARAAPLGDVVVGQDASALGDTGFSALFAGLMQGGDAAATVPEMPATVVMPQLAKAAKLAATGGRLPQAATETGKKLPLSASDAETAEDSDGQEVAPDAAQLALAFTAPTLPLALAEPISTSAPDTVSTQQLVAGQATASSAPAAASASAAAVLLTGAIGPKQSAAAHDAPTPPSVQLVLAPEPETATATAPMQAELRPAAVATASQLQFQMQALPAADGKSARAPAGSAVAAAEPAAATGSNAPVQDKSVAAAPAPQFNTAAQPKSGDRGGDAPAKSPASEPASTATASPAAPDLGSAPAPALSVAAPAGMASAPGSAIPGHTTAIHHAQDVARIIDQLAAAREALAPATAALSIDHAEFGQLSLRIDQRADGGLAVQLAAANPEAHRAVTAAMNAQGGNQLAQGDSQTGNQPQGNAPSANGNSADRNNRSGTAPGRQDQPAAQRRSASTTTGGEPQTGTFA